MNNQSIKYQGIVPRGYSPSITRFMPSGLRRFTPRVTNFVRSFAPVVDVAGTTFLGTAPGTFSNMANQFSANVYNPGQGIGTGVTIPGALAENPLANLPVDRFARPNIQSAFTPTPGSLPVDRFARPNIQSAFTSTSLPVDRFANPNIQSAFTPTPGSLPVDRFARPTSVGGFTPTVAGGAGLGVTFGMRPTVSRGQQFIDASAYMAEGTPSAAATTPSATTTPSTTTTTSAATTPSGAQEVVTTSTTPPGTTSADISLDESANIATDRGLSTADEVSTGVRSGPLYEGAEGAVDTTRGGLAGATEQATNTLRDYGLNVLGEAQDIITNPYFYGVAAPLAAKGAFGAKPRTAGQQMLSAVDNNKLPPNMQTFGRSIEEGGYYARQKDPTQFGFMGFYPFSASRNIAQGLGFVPRTAAADLGAAGNPYDFSAVSDKRRVTGKENTKVTEKKDKASKTPLSISNQEVLDIVNYQNQQSLLNNATPGASLALGDKNINPPANIVSRNMRVIGQDGNGDLIFSLSGATTDGSNLFFVQNDAKGFRPLQTDIVYQDKGAARGFRNYEKSLFPFDSEASSATVFNVTKGSNMEKLVTLLNNTKDLNLTNYTKNIKKVPSISIKEGGNLPNAGDIKLPEPLPGTGTLFPPLGSPGNPRPMPNFIGPAGPYGSVYPQNIVEGLRRFNPPTNRSQSPGIDPASTYDPNRLSIIDPNTGLDILDPANQYANARESAAFTPRVPGNQPLGDALDRTVILDESGNNILNPGESFPSLPPLKDVIAPIDEGTSFTPRVPGNLPIGDIDKTVIVDSRTGRDVLDPTNLAGKQMQIVYNNKLLPGVIETTDGYFIKNPNTGRYEPWEGQKYYRNGGAVMFNPFMR